MVLSGIGGNRSRTLRAVVSAVLAAASKLVRMGCDGGDIGPQPLGFVVEGPGGGSGQKRAPGSRVWEGAVGTWPESSHTASDCGRLTGYPNLTPLLPTHIVRRGPKSDRSYLRVAD